MTSPELKRHVKTEDQKFHFSSAQRRWFERAYGDLAGRICYFPVYDEKNGWQFCGSTRGLELHHIIPEYMFRLARAKDENNENGSSICKQRCRDKNPTDAYNGIYLCSYHHRGRGYDGSVDLFEDVVPVVHPRRALGKRERKAELERTPEAVRHLIEQYKLLEMSGIRDYNPDWDFVLEEIAREAARRHLMKHPNDLFPYKEKTIEEPQADAPGKNRLTLDEAVHELIYKHDLLLKQGTADQGKGLSFGEISLNAVLYYLITHSDDLGTPARDQEITEEKERAGERVLFES